MPTPWDLPIAMASDAATGLVASALAGLHKRCYQLHEQACSVEDWKSLNRVSCCLCFQGQACTLWPATPGQRTDSTFHRQAC